MSLKYTAGDIIIGKFPHSDSTEVQVRNFLVIAIPHPDFVWGLMMSRLTSIGQNDGSLYEINPNEIDFQLREPTGIRMSILQTIHVNVIHKPLGKLNTEALERVMVFVNSKLNPKL